MNFDTNFDGVDTKYDQAVEFFRSELAKATPTDRRRIMEKFILAALGVIPWVGGFISAAASIKTEEGAIRTDNLQTRWLEEHTHKIENLKNTLEDITTRFELLGSQIDERIQSEEYLSLVRRAFRAWDNADTEEKRRYVGTLISNAAGTRLCSDDVVRLFIDWIDQYHEIHFAVIREIYQNPGITRFEIWDTLNGKLPREDSAEADIYKLLIRDLSTGEVIRQARETDETGRFLRKRPVKRRGPAPTTVESPFEDSKPYVLTELGQQFVHYTMNEVVPRIGGDTSIDA
ncbi:MAG: hypothetical protein ACYC25_12010 [Paludibacter sp.]